MSKPHLDIVDQCSRVLTVNALSGDGMKTFATILAWAALAASVAFGFVVITAHAEEVQPVDVTVLASLI